MDLKNEQDSADKKGFNTEYLPTKCRVTKPPPPKPAANPLQFVKVAPCPLFQKAKEQIKKVEEVKSARKEVLEETEDWQQNLDNWKSSRRKRQEHIIERVVEVKKLEQEENRSRRKPKTFTEMMEERSKGRHKFNIPVYNDDDTNDLSDYGIGSSSSKANSIRDVDTDDNCSQLDEKEFNASNQSESEQETNVRDQHPPKSKPIFNNNNETPKISEAAEPKEQYTYEGAIQDYRTRIRSKINIDESVFQKSSNDFTKTREDVENIVPKGNISKRKEIFEVEKSGNSVSDTNSRLSEAFSNTQSIKDRLKSLEQCTAQPVKSQLVTKKTVNNNNERFEPSSSPEAEMYMNKLNIFNRDLDLLYNNEYEDSGIHTADVSCSVSQSDEPFDIIDEKPNLEYLKQATVDFLASERKSSDIIRIFYMSDAPISNLTPPKVKPPPPPPPECDGNGNIDDNFLGRRMNSTKRIKKEIYMKRSSFLGLDEPTDDQIDPEVSKPPDVDRFLQRELYKKLESREGEQASSPDSGVGVDRMKSSTPLHGREDGQLHGREDSQLSFTSEEDEIRKKEQEIIELIEKEEKNSCKTARFQEERRSMENICDIDDYESNFSVRIQHRKSMPELEHILLEYCKPLPSTPSYKSNPDIKFECEKSPPKIQAAYNRPVFEYLNPNTSPPRRILQTNEEFLSPIHKQQPILPEKPPRLSDIERMQHVSHRSYAGNRGLQSLSAAPKTRRYDNWVRPKAEKKNYNHHWVFQEAELRRLSQQNAPSQIQRSPNMVPQAIQPLPQRVHRTVFPAASNSQHPYLGHHPDQSQLITCPLPFHTSDSQDKMLSVSGKKKCSNCGNELGRGAAMIIESLCLFYHMECFKCCVCHMRLGDGRMGTDVRVRNQKLHCHNCYSSEDGVKFSCV